MTALLSQALHTLSTWLLFLAKDVFWDLLPFLSFSFAVIPWSVALGTNHEKGQCKTSKIKKLGSYKELWRGSLNYWDSSLPGSCRAVSGLIFPPLPPFPLSTFQAQWASSVFHQTWWARGDFTYSYFLPAWEIPEAFKMATLPANEPLLLLCDRLLSERCC